MDKEIAGCQFHLLDDPKFAQTFRKMFWILVRNNITSHITLRHWFGAEIMMKEEWTIYLI